MPLNLPDHTVHAKPPQSSPRLRSAGPIPRSSQPPPADTKREPADVINPPTEKASPVIKTAMYGAEMLCGSLGVSHSINLHIVGVLMPLLFHQKMFILLHRRRCMDLVLRQAQTASVSLMICPGFWCRCMPFSVWNSTKA
jgi:hypothetical protein